MSDTNCPYCNAEVEICHDDGQGYAEGVTHHEYCGRCEKYFAYTTSISFYYSPSKADCLNGGDHKFKATTTYPREFTKMECIDCGEIRTPTELEMKEILEKHNP